MAKQTMYVLDYKGKKHYIDVAVEDVEYVDVEILSGDEVLTIHLRNGDGKEVDAGDFIGGRLISEYHGRYTVPADQLDKWNKRKESYDWLSF